MNNKVYHFNVLVTQWNLTYCNNYLNYSELFLGNLTYKTAFLFNCLHAGGMLLCRVQSYVNM